MKYETPAETAARHVREREAADKRRLAAMKEAEGTPPLIAMPLKTETNTPEMAERIGAAFNEWRPAGQHPSWSTDFEHGQHWITCPDCGAQWSVNDATGPGSVDGFSFEEVTAGDGSCEEGSR